MDGVECTKKLRENNYDGTIIGITCYADKESYDQCLSAGMNAVLPKPISEGDLLTLVKKYQ